MSDRTKQITTALVAAGVGIGVLYVVARYRKDIIRKLSSRKPEIVVVSSFEEAQKVVERIKRHTVDYNVLGLDSEWVTVGGQRRPIALLQLSTDRGFTALFRLCKMRGIAPELRELLENDEIVKVGVGIHDDSMHLARDYALTVGSTLDIRYLAYEAGARAEGLAKMSENILGIKLDKSWKIRCSDWEAQELSPRQIDYAAKDAFVGIELFKEFAERIEPAKIWQSREKALEQTLERCHKYLDIHYKDYGLGKLVKAPSGFPTKQFKRFTSSIRKKPLYDNCVLEAPDGELLCACERSKVDWYVSKGLGEVVKEEPYTVRLNFEPAGRAVGEVGRYYQTAKENKCVVCGRGDSFIRKNVVPRDYRKHFPLIMKDHTSHDILLLCVGCHQISNVTDLRMREHLAELCSAPMHADGNTKRLEMPDLRKIKSAARALLYNAAQIPEWRRQKLKETLKEHLGEEEEVTAEVLQEYAEIGTFRENENYLAHGRKVVDYFTRENGGIVQLERMWRQHFIDTMKPKYLPEYWSVDHNASRLQIRADEGRIENDDLLVAGLGPRPLTNGEVEKEPLVKKEERTLQNNPQKTPKELEKGTLLPDEDENSLDDSSETLSESSTIKDDDGEDLRDDVTISDNASIDSFRTAQQDFDQVTLSSYKSLDSDVTITSDDDVSLYSARE